MSEWRRIKLEELYEVHNGLSKARSFFGSGYPFLSFSTVFNNWFLPESLDSLVQSTAKERESFSIKRGDVFITRTSETPEELGMSSVALKDYPDATFNGFCKRLRQINDAIIPEFAGYVLRSYDFRSRFYGLAGNMTSRASLRNEDLLEMTVSLPPLATQRRIASVLSNYDSAIANCRRQIALLEETAMRFYKEWFKDGKGEKVKLTDLADITYGYPFESRLFNTKKLGRPIVRIRNVPIGQSQDYTTEVTKDMYLVHDGDLLIGMDGEFHMNFWSGGDAWLVQRTCKLAPKDKCHSGFIAEAIRAPIKAFQSAIVGSTVGHLGKADIDTIEIPCPEVEKSKRLQVGFETRVKLRQQIRTLTEARDRLLPKLMKGEIAV